MIRTIHIDKADGLGARLIATLNIWRYARQSDIHVEMYWPVLTIADPKIGRYANKVEDVLDVDAINQRTEGRLRFAETPSGINAAPFDYDAELLDDLKVTGIHPDRLFALSNDIVSLGRRPIMLPSEVAQNQSVDFAETLRDIVPSKAVLSAYNHALNLIGATPIVAIHVRRGDVRVRMKRAAAEFMEKPYGEFKEQMRRQMRDYARRCPPVEALLDRVDAVMPRGGKIVLFADEQSEVEQVRSFAPNRPWVDYPAAHKGLTPVQSAMLDILVLRRATHIVAGHSAFTSLPAMTSNAELHIVSPNGADARWARQLESEILDGIPHNQLGTDFLLTLYSSVLISARKKAWMLAATGLLPFLSFGAEALA